MFRFIKIAVVGVFVSGAAFARDVDHGHQHDYGHGYSQRYEGYRLPVIGGFRPLIQYQASLRPVKYHYIARQASRLNRHHGYWR
jgi:hypothetical protein